MHGIPVRKVMREYVHGEGWHADVKLLADVALLSAS